MTTIASDNLDLDRRVGRSLWGDALRKLSRDKVAVACFGVIVIYAAVAIFAPVVFPHWDASYNYNNPNARPSLKDPFGTDLFGRSILQKTLAGFRARVRVTADSSIANLWHWDGTYSFSTEHDR